MRTLIIALVSLLALTAAPTAHAATPTVRCWQEAQQRAVTTPASACFNVQSLGGDYGACTSKRVIKYEDDRCWSWPTDGNRRRGVVTVDGTPMVVSMCRFAALYRAHELRYRITVDGVTYPLLTRMRGDHAALRAYDLGACDKRRSL